MSWRELSLRLAKRRAEAHKNIEKYLRKIAEAAKRLDKDAEVYLFGSVAEGKSLPSSDIDVLIITRRKPGEVLAALWEEGIGDPFEIHVATPEELEIYNRRAKLVKIDAADKQGL
ncbi:MAG: nucleotidyltransferase domain-containing protein [Thermoproteus sp. AZ2]|uniref:Nucleotidyltransferase domain-containing protein n=1 Tax=Thermoproteus sp. AZ2 TaxID=1609232 RepID=A0ACC6V2Q5_9CREN